MDARTDLDATRRADGEKDARIDAERKGSERSENQCVIARRERSKGWGLTRARSRAMGFIRRSPTVIRRSPSVARRSPSVIRRSPSVIRRSSLAIRHPSLVARRSSLAIRQPSRPVSRRPRTPPSNRPSGRATRRPRRFRMSDQCASV